jgi:ketosteroid isomerase-like protein
LLIFVFGLATFAVRGQKETKDAKTPVKAEQQLLELNERWAEAIHNGDASALDRLFADDIIVTTSSGAIRDKAGEIKDAAGSPDPDFHWTRPFTTEDVRIKVYQDAAVVTGMAKWGFRYKEQVVNNERRYTHTYVKLNGEWKIVAQQTSPNLYRQP